MFVCLYIISVIIYIFTRPVQYLELEYLFTWVECEFNDADFRGRLRGHIGLRKYILLGHT